MKKIIFLLITIFTISNLYAEKKERFFISTKAEGDSSGKVAEAYLSYFETQVFNKLLEVYPCLEINSLSTVSALLDLERQKQLLGAGNDNAIENIAQSMGCQYLISLKVNVRSNTAIISAVCIDNKKANALSRASAAVPHGEQGLNAMDKVTNELIDGLKEYEICPFKGKVNLTVTGELKDKKEEQYPVYCNKMDGIYKKITSVDNYSKNEWLLEKSGKYSASGFVKLNISEETIVEENNPCYMCSKNKEGQRFYSEKITNYLILEGLSRESEYLGEKVDDARVMLTFLDDDTYIIRIKAASNKGDKVTIKDIHAEGACENINKKPERTVNKTDEGLNEVLGPFKGNAQDKTLYAKDIIKRKNPGSGEEETIEYEFNLIRD